MRKSAWTSGWCWCTRAPARWHKRACRMSTCVVPRQGHLAARKNSIRGKHRLVNANSEAGMARHESTGLALKNAAAPSPEWLRYRPLAKLLVSVHPDWSSAPKGRPVSGSWSGGATHISHRTRFWFTCLPGLYHAFRAVIVWASCDGNACTSDCPSVEVPILPALGGVFALGYFVTSYTSMRPLTIPQMRWMTSELERPSGRSPQVCPRGRQEAY